MPTATEDMTPAKMREEQGAFRNVFAAQDAQEAKTGSPPYRDLPTPVEVALQATGNMLLEQKYPARAGAIRLGRAAGLNDLYMQDQIDAAWNQLRSAGFDDVKISEMYQGKRPFPPAIDISSAQSMTINTLDEFQKSTAPSEADGANVHSLQGMILDSAKKAAGIAESAISGLTAGLVTPRMLEETATRTPPGQHRAEAPLAETAIGDTTKEISNWVGSGIAVAALSGLSGLNQLAAKTTSPALKAAIQWGGATFVYNAINQLADHGKIDIGKLAESTGEAALFAGVIGKLTGPAKEKLGELVNKKTAGVGAGAGARPTESQSAHLNEAASDMEKSFGKSKGFQEAKMEVGESTTGVKKERPRPNLSPDIAERETLTASFKAKHPEVPEAQVASMSNLDLKQKINWSYDPRQNLDNKSALDRLANDRGLIPLVGENRWGVISPGGRYRAFTSEDEMLNHITMQPTKSLAPVNKAMGSVLEGTLNAEGKEALVRQKLHVESGFKEFTKDAPSGLGVRPVLSEGQVVKPYEQLFDDEGAKRMAANISQDGLTPHILPAGTKFRVVASNGTGEGRRAVDLYQRDVAWRGTDKPGEFRGGTPDEYIWMRRATGQPVTQEEAGWIKGRHKNLAAATGMTSRKASGHKAASPQIQSFFEQLPGYLETKGITAEAGKNIERILTRELGNELADARTLEPNIAKRMAKIDAVRVAQGMEPITKDLLAMLQRRPER